MSTIRKILILLTFLVLVTNAQTWNLVGGRLLPANRFYIVDLRRSGLGTGFVVGYFNPASPDSGSLRFNNGILQYYDGGAWQTLSYAGSLTGFTKQQIDTVGTVVSGVWQSTDIGIAYLDTSQLSAKYYQKNDTISILASKEFVDNKYVPLARTITIAATSPLSSSAGAQSLAANRTWTLSIPNSANMVWEDSSNTFSTGTTQTMDKLRIYTTDSLALYIVSDFPNIYGSSLRDLVMYTANNYNHSAHYTGRRSFGTSSAPTPLDSGAFIVGFTAEGLGNYGWERAGFLSFFVDDTSLGLTTIATIATDYEGLEQRGFYFGRVNDKPRFTVGTGLTSPAGSLAFDTLINIGSVVMDANRNMMNLGTITAGGNIKTNGAFASDATISGVFGSLTAVTKLYDNEIQVINQGANKDAGIRIRGSKAAALNVANISFENDLSGASLNRIATISARSLGTTSAGGLYFSGAGFSGTLTVSGIIDTAGITSGTGIQNGTKPVWASQINLGTIKALDPDEVLTSATSISIGATNALTTFTGATAVEDSFRVGTSTPAKINSNGSFTGKNLSQLDSVQVHKINFLGTIPSQKAGEIYWDSTARAFKGWEYIVLRSFDMTHGIITADVVDTNSLSETTLYTASQGANFPSVGKVVKIELYGDYTTTGGGAKTLVFRVKKGTTVIDSTIVTTAAGGSTTQAWELREIFTYRAIGASGLIQSAVIVRSENSDYKGSKSTSIDTTTDNTITVTVQLSATGANYCYLRQGLTHTYD